MKCLYQTFLIKNMSLQIEKIILKFNFSSHLLRQTYFLDKNNYNLSRDQVNIPHKYYYPNNSNSNCHCNNNNNNYQFGNNNSNKNNSSNNSNNKDLFPSNNYRLLILFHLSIMFHQSPISIIWTINIKFLNHKSHNL